MEVEKQCFEIFAQKISAKNMNNDLVFFRDKIKIFLISWFETRSRFVSSTSRASRRDREFVPSNLEFRDGDEILKKISRGRARYLVAKSHEIFRDRDISPCSALNIFLRGGNTIDHRIHCLLYREEEKSLGSGSFKYGLPLNKLSNGKFPFMRYKNVTVKPQNN